LDGRLVVVGGTHEHGRALPDAYDPRERVGPAGHVADEFDPVADRDSAPAELPRPHGGHRDVRFDKARVPAPVDPDDHRLQGCLVSRAAAGALPGGPTRAHPDVVLVVVASPPQPSPPAPALVAPSTIADHSPGNSGSVFAVHATSVSSTPGTVRPT